MEKLPTQIELIEKALSDLKGLDLHEHEKERLTQVASNLSDLYREAVKSREPKPEY